MRAFLDSAPAVAIDDVVDPVDFAPDRWALDGRVLSLAYPDGSGGSKLTTALLERRLGVQLTARNRRTVERLAEMARR